MLKRLLVAVAATLALAACESHQQANFYQAAPQTVYQPPAATAPSAPAPEAPEFAGFACRPGEHVPDSMPGVFRISVFAVWQNLAVLRYIENTTVGDYAIPLLKAADGGQVAHWDGQGTLTIRIHNVNMDAMPKRLSFLAGRQICQGSVPVKQVGPNIFRVEIPIRGGADLGYAALLIPPQALVTPHMRAWVCVKSSFDTAYLPELTAGPYKGLRNVVCGLPGTTSGQTLLAEKVKQGARWELFPLVAERR